MQSLTNWLALYSRQKWWRNGVKPAQLSLSLFKLSIILFDLRSPIQRARAAVWSLQTRREECKTFHYYCLFGVNSKVTYERGSTGISSWSDVYGVGMGGEILRRARLLLLSHTRVQMLLKSGDMIRKWTKVEGNLRSASWSLPSFASLWRRTRRVQQCLLS